MRDINLNGEVNTDIYLEEYNEQFFLDGEVSLSSSIDGISGIVTKVSTADPYTGTYYVTPGGENIVLQTAGLLMVHNVLVYAIETMTEQAIHDAVALGWE